MEVYPVYETLEEAPAAENTEAAPETPEAPAEENTEAAPETPEAPAAENTEAAPETPEAPAEENTEAASETQATEHTEAAPGAECTEGVSGTTEVAETESTEALPETTEVSASERTEAETEAMGETAQEDMEIEKSETQPVSEAETLTEEPTEIQTEETEEPASETEETETETESETEKEAVLESTVKQEAFLEADGSLSVKYTIEVTNITPDAEAEKIAVKAILGRRAAYYGREGQTPNAQYMDGNVQPLAGLNWTELSGCTADQLQHYTSALAWENQTIAAGARAEYVFFAHVGEEAKSTDDVKTICFVSGVQIPAEKTSWINGELVKPLYAEPQTYAYTDNEVTIEVTVPEGVKLPYGTVLSVTPVIEGSAEYEAAVAAVESANGGKSFAEHVLYDINFVCGDQTVEPEGGNVLVSMQFNKPALQIEEAPEEILEDEVVVSHILEDETVENVTQEVQTTDDGAVERVEFATGALRSMH